MVVSVILPQRRQAINCHCADSRPAADGPMVLGGRRRLTVLLVVAAVKFLVDLIVLGAAVVAILPKRWPALFSALGSGGSRRRRR